VREAIRHGIEIELGQLAACAILDRAHLPERLALLDLPETGLGERVDRFAFPDVDTDGQPPAAQFGEHPCTRLGRPGELELEPVGSAREALRLALERDPSFSVDLPNPQRVLERAEVAALRVEIAVAQPLRRPRHQRHSVDALEPRDAVQDAVGRLGAHGERDLDLAGKRLRRPRHIDQTTAWCVAISTRTRHDPVRIPPLA
jgi:hypothetical protein